MVGVLVVMSNAVLPYADSFKPCECAQRMRWMVLFVARHFRT